MWYKLKRIMMRPNGVEKQVRPSGWKPWANTIAYYPLETDFNDASWNSRNLANTNATITSLNWVDCAYYNWNSYSIYEWTALSASDRTFSVWCYVPINNNGTLVHISNYQYVDNTGSLWTNLYQSKVYVSDWMSNYIEYTITQWQWVNVVVAQNNSNVSLYIKWQLAQTISNYPSEQRSSNGWGLWAKFWKNNHSERLTGYLSNVILEDKARTAQEITNYYNLTKSNYGL